MSANFELHHDSEAVENERSNEIASYESYLFYTRTCSNFGEKPMSFFDWYKMRVAHLNFLIRRGEM